MEEDMVYDTTHVSVPGDRWHTDLAVSLVRAAALGYPLTSTEVQLYGVGVEDPGALIEYCRSPWRNPAGRAPVDCHILGRF